MFPISRINYTSSFQILCKMYISLLVSHMKFVTFIISKELSHVKFVNFIISKELNTSWWKFSTVLTLPKVAKIIIKMKLSHNISRQTGFLQKLVKDWITKRTSDFRTVWNFTCTLLRIENKPVFGNFLQLILARRTTNSKSKQWTQIV